MICDGCAHDNQAGARFCNECGAPLATECVQCGGRNPGGAKFCNQCGSPLAIAAGPALPQRSPRDYTPQHLADKILRSKTALEGERKQVTVLFADIKGSMELAERLDPEEWHRILDWFFEIVTDGVHRFEGTVNQYTGDGIMALFGAPISHEDHARRACYAALHLIAALRGLAGEVRREHGVDFVFRLGASSGDVVVGKIGDDLRMDYTAQGHTVGLAQRMEAMAQADSCLVSESTAALVAGHFELEALGELPVKGVGRPVRVHRLVGTGRARSHFDLALERGLTGFVGHRGELQTLNAALERARAGNGSVLGVVAEAGTGKTRLCFEFLESCRAAGLPVYQGHAVSHGRGIPLLPILEVLRDYFGVDERDGGPVARDKIAGRLLLVDEGFRDVLPVMFEFLGVPDAAEPAREMDPGARQLRLFGVLRKLLQRSAAGRPGVILIEDLHWLDAASASWIAEWVDAVARTHNLLLVNFRPEYHAEWMQRSHYQQLPLLPLGAAEFRELLEDLLGERASAAGLAETIHRGTGGNPSSPKRSCAAWWSPACSRRAWQLPAGLPSRPHRSAGLGAGAPRFSHRSPR